MLGLKIGQYLNDKGIKQAYLVNKTGLPAYVVSDICTGKRKSVDAVVYYKICTALGVDLDYFLREGGGTDEN